MRSNRLKDVPTRTDLSVWRRNLKVIVPLVSTFTDDTSSISEVRCARTVKFHIEHGAAGFMVNAATADCYLLPSSERKQVLEWVVRDSQGLPVWLHATTMTTATTVDLCQHAARHGARGVIVTPPPYGGMFANEVRSLLSSVARHGNVQAYYADPDGLWPSMQENSAVPPLPSIDSDIAVGTSASPDECTVEDGIVTPFAMFGADQIDRVISNPDMFKAAMASLLRHGGFGRTARAALVAMGVDAGPARGPILELSDDGKKILLGMLAALGVKH